MADEEVKEGTEEKEKKPKKDSKMGMLIGVIAFILILQVVVAFVAVQLTAPKPKDEVIEQQDEDTTGSESSSAAVIENEVLIGSPLTHIVNISGTDGMRFLKVTLQLAYDEDAPVNAKIDPSVFLGMEARVKNYINQYLSSLTLEEVQTRNAQQNIRRDVLRGINKLLPAGTVELSNVYISEYLIQ